MPILTDTDIQKLIALEKQVTNPKTREKDKLGHTGKNYELTAPSDNNVTFTMYTRQNKKMQNDFSCGLEAHFQDGTSNLLLRYNGSSHVHGNKIENEKIAYTFHIHKAKEAYLSKGYKSDGYAEVTTAYQSLNGALYCLVQD